MLKQTLKQKMLQKLSPQQIQLMKLLQVPTASLEQRIKEELEANPALDEGSDQDEFEELPLNGEENYSEEQSEDYEADEEPREELFELDDYLNDYIEDDPSSYKYKANNYGPDEEDKTLPAAVENSFHEHLEQQLGLLDLKDKRDIIIAEQIVGSIDEDGYLRRDPISIIDDLMFSQNLFTSEEEILKVLSLIQNFDPPGLGARDLQECLLIQMRRRLRTEDLDREETQTLKLAKTVLENSCEAFTKKHYTKLKRQLNIEDDRLKEIIDEILKLNPKPASGFSGSGSANIQYVVPDFTIIYRDGELELTLNSRNAPELRVNDHYLDMLSAYKDNTKGRRANKQEKEAVLFIRQKIDSAKWFIDAIRQRQQTMLKTMYAILQYQYDYFLTGDQKKLRPMILKDIADITGLDISTISRVANSKFVQTEFGTKRLKEFFSESLQTSSGEEVSTLEVKKILGEVIDAENKRKPLSDEKLTKIMKDKGYNIARRTVAKYREQLMIPVARLRKEI